jgi:hypothetical protein
MEDPVHPGLAILVIGRPLPQITQHLIGLGDLLKALLRSLAVCGVPIGVVLHSKPSERLLHLILGGAPSNS